MRTLVLICLLATTWLFGGAARAETAIDVSAQLRGVSIGKRIAILVDPDGRLDIDAVSAPRNAGRFVASREEAPNFGFSTASYWLRIDVQNGAQEQRSWLLELGYPHLDHATLYTPREGGGFDRRDTGDAYLFAQRDIAYRNFLFALDEPPSSHRTYYLKVWSSGALNLPLSAWTTTQFVEHQHLTWTALCAYYGIILIMAAYNACLYFLAKQADFIRYALFVLALGLVQMTYAGHGFQFLLPTFPKLANQLLPAALSLVVLAGCEFADGYLGRRTLHGAFRVSMVLSALLLLGSFVLPYALVIRLIVPVAMIACVIGMVAALLRARSGDRRGKLYVLGWGVFLVGAVATMLRAEGILPVNFVTTWSMQIGSVVQLALLSSMLADNINSMRADLAQLNGQLSSQVSALREALTRAEDATTRAEKATRVKDEFMATMSHEFRTPLNAIINIPQGLLDYFPEFRGAQCSACDVNFELESDERLPDQATCPECHTAHALVEKTMRRYVGAPEHTAAYLGKIERSGQHLLQVVNGILDFSKLESGHFVLACQEVPLAALLSDVVEQMAGLAEAAGVRLTLTAPPAGTTLYADDLRLRQVLINLVGNAIKFSHAQGTVSVEVADERDACLFVVRDEGIGIAAENLESVFGSFEQVDKGNTRRYGGTGLGLSIARSLVQMHGGTMWVESTLGRGASFYFRIPNRVDARVSRTGHTVEVDLGTHKEAWV